MTHTVLMEDCMELLRRMAMETKARHKVGYNEVVVPYLELDYGIKVVYDPNVLMKELGDRSESEVIFASEAQYTMLVLKYL